MSKYFTGPVYVCVSFYLFINFFIGELLGVDYLLSQTGEPLVVDPDSEETENMLEDVDEGGDEEDEGFGEDQTHDIAVSSLTDDPSFSVSSHFLPSSKTLSSTQSAAPSAQPAASSTFAAASSTLAAASSVQPAATSAQPAASSTFAAASSTLAAASSVQPAATSAQPAAPSTLPAASSTLHAASSVQPAATSAQPAAPSTLAAASSAQPAASSTLPAASSTLAAASSAQPAASSTLAAASSTPGASASPDESVVCKYLVICLKLTLVKKKTSRNIYIYVFLSHLTILIMLLNSVFFFQALDSAGVPGIDRVDSLAEYLVELRNQPSLALTNQQVRNIQFSLLSLLDLSYVNTCTCFVFSFAMYYMLSLLR